MPIALTREWVLDSLPPREGNAHKGTYGTLNIVAGSLQYRGAPVLNTAAALRTGAGLVRLVSTPEVCNAAAASLPCALLQPVETDDTGGILPMAGPLALGGKPTCILAGSGMGNTACTAAVVHTLLQSKVPLVLDADALNVIAGHYMQNAGNTKLSSRLRKELGTRGAPTILTPHAGEMARLAGCEVKQLATAEGMEQVGRSYAKQNRCVLVIKSSSTYIAGPEGDDYILANAANPGLAKGGSGDVLAGIIASLCTQGLTPVKAAAAGVWLHSQAGLLLAERDGYMALSPMDLPAALVQVLHSLNR